MLVLYALQGVTEQYAISEDKRTAAISISIKCSGSDQRRSHGEAHTNIVIIRDVYL